MSQQGIGMTSQRTRERLIQRLMDQGISQFEVLEAIRSVPRHLFVDEALAHRSYEDTALPIGYGQTLSQPYMVARMSQLALARGRPKKVLELGSGSGYQTAILASLVDEICAAAPETLPAALLEQLAPDGRLILPVGGRRQQLMMVTSTTDGYIEEIIEEVNFVPMLQGVVR